MGNRRIIRPSCAIIAASVNECIMINNLLIMIHSFTEAVEGKRKYFQGRHEPVPAYKNI